MKYIIALLAAAYLLGAPLAVAQESFEVAKAPAAKSKAKRKRVYRKPSNFHRAGLSVLFWQERIEGKKGAEKTDIETQLDGVQGHYNYNIPFSRSPWRQSYEASLALGRLKGKGTTTTIADELKDQPWLSVSFMPALMGRSTQASEFGIGVPLTYRIIQWKLKGGGLDMDKDQSYSAGVSAIYLNNFSKRNSLKVLLTYQHMWQTAAWSLGWELRL